MQLGSKSRLYVLFASGLTAGALCAPSASAQANLSKGYQILLDRGVQLQGMVTPDDDFHLSTYQDIGYTSVDWLYSNDVPNSNVGLLGPAPGFPWSRWVDKESDMPPQGSEGAYMSQLVGLALVDEQNLDDPTTRNNMVTLFNDVQNNPAYANTMLYTNNYGGQVSDSALGDFITRANPDMLFFDTYPFKSQYDTTQPNDIGASLPMDNIPWESELRRYRQWSINTNRPFGAYMQTFHAVQSYNQTVYRDPSPSELRFNNTAAIAFNAKWLTGFTYNTGASSLFTTPGGDTYPTPLYAEQKLVNTRLKNWSNTLVRLTPVADLHNPNDTNPPPGPVSNNPNFPDGTTTSIMIVRGKNASGTPNPLPIGFQADPDSPNSYSWYEAGANDPYFNGWVVNNTGTKNNGQPGDVIISWFKPLDESFDGPNYSNEKYVMVVNGLTDPTGSAADCTQLIKINFLNLPDGDPNTPGNQGIEMLDPDTGKITIPTLTQLNSTKVQLSLSLAGGDAALFKYNDGAPFVGIDQVPEPASLALAGLGLGGLFLKRRRARA